MSDNLAVPEQKVETEPVAEGKKLYVICKEHVWTSTFQGAHCPVCAQQLRADRYSQQRKDADARTVDREAQFHGISG